MRTLLLLGSAVLALVVALQWALPVEKPRRQEQKVLPQSTSDQPVATERFEFELPEQDSFAVVSSRPLFTKGRRPEDPLPEPAEKVVPKAPAPKQAAPRITLSAIIDLGGKRYAILQGSGKDRKSSERLKQGDLFQGWRVKAVEEKQLILTQGRETETYQLWKYKKVPLPKAAAPRVKKRVAQNQPKAANKKRTRLDLPNALANKKR